jgi:hypothetical protein
MTPYTGPWTKTEAAHLLRRTVFGATNQQILDVVSNGMQNTVSSILQIPAINPPLAYLPEETIVAQEVHGLILSIHLIMKQSKHAMSLEESLFLFG